MKWLVGRSLRLRADRRAFCGGNSAGGWWIFMTRASGCIPNLFWKRSWGLGWRLNWELCWPSWKGRAS